MNSFAFTCGDVNGIGPEIVVKTLNKISPKLKQKLIFICPKNVFENLASTITINFSYKIVSTIPDFIDKLDVIILDIGYCKISPGKVTKSAGYTSYKSIVTSCELAKKGIVDSIITAPISKHAFIKAGINFPGHTELLADFFKVRKFSMMFVSKKMKAALATIHIPIKKVSNQLTSRKLESVIGTIRLSLKMDFDISNPKIAILGLNPHAGESGNIGIEEIKVIEPLLKKYGDYVFGPFVPDAYFGNKLFNNFDCTIGMYHDQVLIPFKLLNYNRGVNFTAGLPIVRTSPDHGTAFDIAGKGIAKEDSIVEAFMYAKLIVNNRKKHC